MKVLYISPLGNPRCGEKTYGQIWVEALRAQGVDVHEWDGWYPHAKEHGYLPPDANSYDLIHVNWGPANMGHYLPEHIPSGVPLSVFLHDVPPNSTCSLVPRAQLLMSYDPMEGSHVIDHAVPEGPFPKDVATFPKDAVVVGVSGVRNDPGHYMVRDLCARRGWIFNAPTWWDGSMGGVDGPWLDWRSEIARLSASTFNVCWYQTTGRGKSMAAMFCVAAQRPLVLSGSTMFSALEPYSNELYQTSYFDAPWLEDVTTDVLRDNCELVPSRAARELSWTHCATRIKTLWESVALGAR